MVPNVIEEPADDRPNLVREALRLFARPRQDGGPLDWNRGDLISVRPVSISSAFFSLSPKARKECTPLVWTMNKVNDLIHWTPI